jgi:hypothetical protein
MTVVVFGAEGTDHRKDRRYQVEYLAGCVESRSRSVSYFHFSQVLFLTLPDLTLSLLPPFLTARTAFSVKLCEVGGFGL